jgi:hypothetical protein
MRRRLWWLIGVGGVAGWALMAQVTNPRIGPFQPAERTNPVTYDISAQLVFTPPVGTKVAHVWIVKPPDDAGQEVLAFETDPKPTMEAPDPLYGNRLVYFRLDNPDGAQVIRYRLKIRVYELHWNLRPHEGDEAFLEVHQCLSGCAAKVASSPMIPASEQLP